MVLLCLCELVACLQIVGRIEEAYAYTQVLMSDYMIFFFALLAPKTKMNDFLKIFRAECPRRGPGVKNFFQKMLILVFEV